MSPDEFQYIQRAVKALEGPVTLMERIKIERTMGQILVRSADRLEQEFSDKVDRKLAVSHLVDILKR